MKMTRRRLLVFGIGVVILGTTTLGAYGDRWFFSDRVQEESFARFQPSDENAQSALQDALRAWQQGQPPGHISGRESPTVYLVDTCRRSGQSLQQFTILGETAGEGPRCYAVRVAYANPQEEGRLRFVVFGCDPLWVYRYEDYEMMTRWECGRDQLIKSTAEKKNSE